MEQVRLLARRSHQWVDRSHRGNTPSDSEVLLRIPSSFLFRASSRAGAAVMFLASISVPALVATTGARRSNWFSAISRIEARLYYQKREKHA
jgi:hypothetical protein